MLFCQFICVDDHFRHYSRWKHVQSVNYSCDVDTPIPFALARIETAVFTIETCKFSNARIKNHIPSLVLTVSIVLFHRELWLHRMRVKTQNLSAFHKKTWWTNSQIKIGLAQSRTWENVRYTLYVVYDFHWNRVVEARKISHSFYFLLKNKTTFSCQAPPRLRPQASHLERGGTIDFIVYLLCHKKIIFIISRTHFSTSPIHVRFANSVNLIWRKQTGNWFRVNIVESFTL